MDTDDKVRKLRGLICLLVEASEVIIKEWKVDEQSSMSSRLDPLLPSLELYNARRTIVGACGMCTDLVQEPQNRLMETAAQYYVSRALHVAAQGRIADIVSNADQDLGMHIREISHRTGIDEQKLARFLRCLCSVHIFTEVKAGYFANSESSRCLVNNEPLRCWLLINGLDIYTASDKLLSITFNTVKTHSSSLRETAFQEALGTHLTFWEYLEQGIDPVDGSKDNPRGLEIFTLAMLGGGRVHAPPLYADYPWGDLASSTVVDVGGGIGGMSLDLARRFPKLQFVLQDREPVIRQAESLWVKEHFDLVESQRITFMVHDFFVEQPVKGSEVYLMRYVLHDWPDEECVQILSRLSEAMAPHSRILTADQVIHTTVGSPYLKPAPPPLPANYGYAHQLSHIRDLNMMTLFNGMERTPEHLDALARRVGLRVVRVWECRGMVSITEMRRDNPGDPLL